MRSLGSADVQADLVNDFDAKTVESNHFARVIRQHANALEAEVDQDLRANAAFALDEALAVKISIDLLAIVKMNARQLARFRIACVDLKACAQYDADTRKRRDSPH